MSQFIFLARQDKKSKAGFTMVELLIVVAIIGLLVTLTLISISDIRAKTRDTQRVADIKAVQESLAMYQSNYGEFPVYDGYITGDDDMSLALEAEGFVRSVPVDPIDATEDGTIYRYYYYSETGDDYIIQFNLETDSIEGRSQGLNSVSP